MLDSKLAMLDRIETQENIYTVSELNAEAKASLESTFDIIWLIGEISNLARPHSGHLYFSLKDSNAQVRSALFRHQARGLSFTPENGQQVLVRAKLTLYEARGDFQLVVQSMELAGDGALQLAFEKLKRKLSAEGLFNPENKKPLPKAPKTIGIITSASGAALHDILNVLRRRSPFTQVTVYPTLVQGDMAAEQIVSAIQTANQRDECEVLILARGGGSLEDLWPFNQAEVAYAIFASKLPIISGVGHEVDFTIADFVADQRAPTPSAAAELVSTDISAVYSDFSHLYLRLQQLAQQHLQKLQLTLTTLAQRLRHPKQQLNEYAERIARIQQHLTLVLQHHLQAKRSDLQQQLAKLLPLNPQQRLRTYRQEILNLHDRLFNAVQQQLGEKQSALQALTAQLNSISPLETLSRGYAIASKDNVIVRNANQVNVKDNISLTLHHGKLRCVVEEIE